MKANDENASNLIALIVTAAMAPAISHALTIFLGPEQNIWTTDRLLILLFASLSGLLISTELQKRVTKLTKPGGFLHKGLVGGDYDIFFSFIWCLPIITTCVYYDSIGFGIILLLYITVTLIILIVNRHVGVSAPSFTKTILAALLPAILFGVLYSFPSWAEATEAFVDGGRALTFILSLAVICPATTYLRLRAKKKPEKNDRSVSNESGKEQEDPDDSA